MNHVDQLIKTRPGFGEMEPANLDAAVRLNEFIYMSTGTSNAYLVVTDNGRVIINTGLGFEALTHRKLFDEVCDRPSSHILLTQGHVDHVGGVGHFRDVNTRVVAQENNARCQHDDARIQQVRSGQAYIWFSKTIDHALHCAREHPEAMAQDHPTPDITFAESTRLQVEGLEIELFATPGGETVDSCVVWLPQHRILFSGNLFGPLFPHFPNFNTIRGDQYRHVEPYLESLALVRALQPEMLITGHFEPVVGEKLIRDSLDRLEQAVSHVFRETLTGMNSGKDIYTLMREVALPEKCQVGQGYGKVSWAVRTIWESYMGWFKARSTSELYATRVDEQYADLAELAGVDALIARGRSKLQSDDPESALYFADIALAADAANRDALALSIDCHRALRSRVSSPNFWEDGWLAAHLAQLEQRLGQ